MKIKSLFILLLTSVLFINCSTQPKDVTAEIVEANKDFIAAFNANDPIAMGQVYTENGKLFPANSLIVEGRDAIENFWKGVFEMGITKGVLTTNYAEGFGETAIEEGKYALYDSNENKLDEGKYIVIWKKVDGQWKYDKDIWNTSMPAAQ